MPRNSPYAINQAGMLPRPHSTEPPLLRKRPLASQRSSTPGPGAYFKGGSNSAPVGRSKSMGSVGKAQGHAFGKAGRFDYINTYMTKRHNASSIFQGRTSPGPKYNVSDSNRLAGDRQPAAYSFGSDVNRPSAYKGSSISPGPIYYPDVSLTQRQSNSFSVGSGHNMKFSSISPGPVYDVSLRTGEGNASVAGLPKYTFRGGKTRSEMARIEKTKMGAVPGPGTYNSRHPNNIKRAAPCYTMYQTYNWRKKGPKAGGVKAPRADVPPPNLGHGEAGKGTAHGRESPAWKFGTDGRYWDHQ